MFIHATFKVASMQNFKYAHNDKTKFTIPFAFVLMTNKSYLSYIKILKCIKLIVENDNINLVYSAINLCVTSKSFY